ncbi:hypothetical protein ACWFRM_36530 [Streptomyces sp. NPDC055144]
MISAESYIGSNDFWNTLIAVFVAVVAALLAAWATLRSVNPRRRLVWRQHVNSNLFRDAGAATAIGVSYGQSVVSEPRLVELLVKNAGRRDLQSSDFVNADNSLVFDFGVPVVAVLNSAVQPPTAAPSVTSHTGSELRIHPGLIAKGQVITFSVLVDGPERDVKPKVASILETPVKEGNQADFETATRRLFRVGQVVLPVVVAILAGYLTISVSNTLNETGEMLRDNTKSFQDASDAVKEASHELTHLRNCRYWDAHDPKRAKKECPEITAPAPDNK